MARVKKGVEIILSKQLKLLDYLSFVSKSRKGNRIIDLGAMASGVTYISQSYSDAGSPWLTIIKITWKSV